MKEKIMTTTLLFCACFTFAQQGFIVVGGDSGNGSGSVSFSVGQVEYNYTSTVGHIIIEGLQQPYEMPVLPISLLYFSAKATKENTVELIWSTVSESNNDYFTVEKSKDGKEFEEVSKITSYGNSNTRQDYTATDHVPFDGVSFYRLKQTDKNGQFTWSQTVIVQFSKPVFSATTGPNPAIDVISLYLKGKVDKGLHYRLLGVEGKHLSEGKITGNTTIINLNRVARGTYLLQVIKNSQVVNAFKVIRK